MRSVAAASDIAQYEGGVMDGRGFQADPRRSHCAALLASVEFSPKISGVKPWGDCIID